MNALKPEERARLWIDMKLREAGWRVINRDEFSPDMTAVAIREASLQDRLEADYILFINGKATAVLEAKRNEIALDNPNLIIQAENYSEKLPKWYATWGERTLPLIYLSNGKEIAFKDRRTPNSKYEFIKKFPRPWDVVRKLNLGEFAGLPHLSPNGLRQCQYDALYNLEQSFKAGKKRAVMVLATGSGKTFAACMMIYRMLTYTNMNRVLFLVDRNNLGVAAKTALQTFTLTESGKPISEIYGTEHLTNRPIGNHIHIVVSTIQRLYSLLNGKLNDSSEEQEDSFSFKDNDKEIELPEHPSLPSDFFDLIIIDECHRSIYSNWQKVLTYFKTARLVGMTATPIPETLAFFDNNVVSKYTYEQSVLDGVNVGFRVYRIKTEIGEEGGDIKTGDKLNVIARKNGENRTQIAIQDRPFEKTQLNRSLVVRDQIRKVLQEYKDAVYTRMYPEREPDFNYLPKTLIFAVSELHAQLIVDVAKEVFGRADDKFVQKITYSVGNSDDLIRSFRNDVDFRIAVTVTLVATGTDVPPLEVLIFFNDVHSETLYQQMKGRGCRTISDSVLQAVTPNAKSKELFFIIDAVGVTESEKYVPAPGDDENSLKPTLEQLFEKMALGYLPDDYFYLLVTKLSCIGNRADPEDINEYNSLCTTSVKEWARLIMEKLDSGSLPPFISVNEPNTERKCLIHDLLANVPARKKLIEIAKGYVKEILDRDDSVLYAGFSTEEAQVSTQAFERYVKEHKDEIEALRLIYNNKSGLLTRALIDDLAKRLRNDLPGFNCARLWNDYALLKPSKVKPLGEDIKAITNLIQLVRFAYNTIDSLYSLTSIAAQRFELWCGQAQRSITPEQKEVFRKIASFVAQNGSCDYDTLKSVIPEYIHGMNRFFSSKNAANAALYSLNEFILKAA